MSAPWWMSCEWARVVPFCRIDTIKERVDGKNAARLLGSDYPQDGNPCRRAAMVLACLPPGETKTPTPTSSSPEVGGLAAVVSACVDAGRAVFAWVLGAGCHGPRLARGRAPAVLVSTRRAAPCRPATCRSPSARLGDAHHNPAPNSPVGGRTAHTAPAMVAPMVSSSTLASTIAIDVSHGALLAAAAP